MVWSTRTTEEKYSVRKLYMSRTVWKTPRRTQLVLSPYMSRTVCPINPELRSIQDLGYYAPRGPNLSKLCATCLFLRVTDLAEATLIYFGYSP
jgi:hypothetical protein